MGESKIEERPVDKDALRGGIRLRAGHPVLLLVGGLPARVAPEEAEAAAAATTAAEPEETVAAAPVTRRGAGAASPKPGTAAVAPEMVRAGPGGAARAETARAGAARTGSAADTHAAEPAPRCTVAIEGPGEVIADEEITLRATALPAAEGTFSWTDAAGRRLGEGAELRYLGRPDPGGKPQVLECRFTAAGAPAATAKHPVAVAVLPTLRLPIHVVGQPRTADTVRWLGENPIEVHVDDAKVAAHTLAEAPGRVVVSFRVQPGTRSVLVTSATARPPPGRPKVRIVHYSAEVTVTAA